MNTPHPPFLTQVRVNIATAIIILVSLFSTVQLNKPSDKIFRNFMGISEIKPNELLTLYLEARLLKAELPRYGAIHYQTDDPIGEKDFIMQHALAPLFLEKNPSHDWWVGRFQSPLSKTKIINSNQLQEIKCAGQGLVLFKRKSLP